MDEDCTRPQPDATGASPINNNNGTSPTAVQGATSSSVDSITCAICQRVFYGSRSRGGLQSNFNRHLLTHSGDRPYGCEQCEMTFTTSSNLRRHVSKRHRGVVGSEAAGTDGGDAAALLGNTNLSRADGSGVGSLAAADNVRSGSAEVGAARTTFVCRVVGCGREFGWKATRTVHEKTCRGDGGDRRRPRAAAAGVHADGDQVGDSAADGMQSIDDRCPIADAKGQAVHHPGAADVADCDADHRHPVVFLECPDCEAVLAGRSKLRRHQAFHCPFRCDDTMGPEDDLYTPTSSGMPVFPNTTSAPAADRPHGARTNGPETLPSDHQPGSSAVVVANKQQRRRHHHRPMLPCQYCEGWFRNERLLKAHVARRHPRESSATCADASDDNRDATSTTDDDDGWRKRSRSCDGDTAPTLPRPSIVAHVAEAAPLFDYWRLTPSQALHTRRHAAAQLLQQPTGAVVADGQPCDDEPYLELCVSDAETGGGGSGAFVGLSNV